MQDSRVKISGKKISSSAQARGNRRLTRADGRRQSRRCGGRRICESACCGDHPSALRPGRRIGPAATCAWRRRDLPVGRASGEWVACLGARRFALSLALIAWPTSATSPYCRPRMQPRLWPKLVRTDNLGGSSGLRLMTESRSAPGGWAGAACQVIAFSAVNQPPLLATSLYEDPSAGLHEDASARLREHLALLGCSILRRTSPPSSAGGHQHPAGGHDEGTVAITESDRILGHCTAGSAAERRLFVAVSMRTSRPGRIQIILFCRGLSSAFWGSR